MCAGHIIDEVVMAMLSCVSIVLEFREGMAFLIANAGRANRNAIAGRGESRADLIAVGGRR